MASFVCMAALVLGLHGVRAETEGIPAPSLATSPANTGDPFGVRQWLAGHGLTYNVTYTNDLLANVRGGNRRGVVDQGKLEGALSIDFERLAGLPGLSFYSNAFQIHNTGRIRRDYVGGLNTIAAIEAVPATRLSEIWLEQKFWHGNASLRAGQLAADVEFFTAGLGDMFLQSDWPTITAVNLPSGGPAYPLSTPGVRLKLDPVAGASILLAVFNGDPAGPGPGDEQLRDRYGLAFRMRDPALVMGEVQMRANQGKEDSGLAHTVKFGGWMHRGTFQHQHVAFDGSLLADPGGSGIAATRRGNAGLYGIIEQQLYRPGGGDATSGISVFSRISASPGDRNPIDVFVDGGIVVANMLAQRPDDRFGASIMYARFSDEARRFDRDHMALSGARGVVRDYEANLELTYVAQIAPGWTAQPVLTHVWHPNGDRRRNAAVTGLRSLWRF